MSDELQPDDPEVLALLSEIREVSDEIGLLGETTDELRTYRIGLCRQARSKGVTTKTLGRASGVSGVAVTLWLHQPVPAAQPA